MFINSYANSKGLKQLNKAGVNTDGKKPWDIKIHDSTAFRDAAFKGSLGFADSYAQGKWDVESIDQMFVKLLEADAVHFKSSLDTVLSLRDKVINSQAGRRAFQVGQKHYDLGNEMYELMLGESMGYSSGKFIKKTDSLDEAQYNKFDALCRKLDLKPGMKVLEIGAGWGTFARHAAKNYGVEVFGLTVSKEQKKFAEERCKGLKVRFLLCDYKKLDSKYDNYFDRVVSIEMIEAVGKKNIPDYFAIIARSLKQDGLVGIQAIVGSGLDDSFLSTRIFPNGHVPSVAEIATGIKSLLRVKQLDSFGKDYDLTLMKWEANFRKNWSTISKIVDENGEKMYDEKFYRMWRFYLLLCAASFRVGVNDVAQIIMTKNIAGA